MARIAGITIPSEKQIEISLTYIYGIGKKFSRDILSKAKVPSDTRVKDLTDSEITRLNEIISNEYMVEGDLQRVVASNVKRLKDIKSYRGLRHNLGLPSRGQRTKTNARTRRGRKTTVGGTAKKGLK